MVREQDRVGNDVAGEVADFGRQRVDYQVTDARRNDAGLCSRWYQVVRDLHRVFIAIWRAAVNTKEGGGTAPHPLVWSAGALPKKA